MQNIIYLFTKKRHFLRRAYLAAACLPVLLTCFGCEKKTGLTFTSETRGEVTGASADMALTSSAAGADSFHTAQQADDSETLVVVHVCGAVMREGVYTLKGGARVIDAVQAAGGFAADADTVFVNQAAFVTDGTRLLIPTVAETKALSEAGQDAPVLSAEGVLWNEAAEDHRININTASATELCSINGIGPGRAQDIIQYREEHGAFTCIEDIMKVSGIKEKLFATIRDYIRV